LRTLGRFCNGDSGADSALSWLPELAVRFRGGYFPEKPRDHGADVGFPLAAPILLPDNGAPAHCVHGADTLTLSPGIPCETTGRMVPCNLSRICRGDHGADTGRQLPPNSTPSNGADTSRYVRSFAVGNGADGARLRGQLCGWCRCPDYAARHHVAGNGSPTRCDYGADTRWCPDCATQLRGGCLPQPGPISLPVTGRMV
jgi:hypothetical protein